MMAGFGKKPRLQSDAPPVLPSAGGGDYDQLGAYPTEVSVPALRGRRYLWTARGFAIGMYLSLIANLALAAALYTLIPLKKVEPLLVTFNEKSDQVVQIEPFEKGVPGFQLMTEKLVGEYVKIREEILPDNEEMARRWDLNGYIGKRTAEQDYRRFISQKTELLAQIRQRGLSRTVDVVLVNSLDPSLYQVEFITTDFDKLGKQIDVDTWVATLRVSYIPQKVEYDERYVNPLGFQVVDYSITKKKSL